MLRRPWTLRTRLVVSAVSLIAVVAAVIGSVTAIAFHSYMYGKLDDQLHSVAERAQRPPGPGPVPQALRAAGPLGFVGGGGQPLGTFGALLGEDGSVTASKVVEDSGLRAQESAKPLTGEQRSALEEAAPGTGEGARSVDLPGLGGYRVEAATTTEGYTVLVGIPSAEVSGALTTLIVVEVCVTAAGLLAASIAGTVLVGVALRPLRRVAATATRVSELPLHSGEVALLERVPDAEADPRTEVGQVGAALNRMLGHVGSALTARQESETRVRQFVADASHELRTPLASIRGYAELTRRATGSREAPERDPVTRHALGRIESEADRMTGLVEDLLLLARLDSGRPLSYGSTDLLPLVVDAISDARAADQGAPGRDARHRWRLELPAEPVTVRADPDRFQQVLVNLLANARTHTPPGTTVTVSVRPPVRAGGPVTLEVRDDGPGIPAELLPHVFERFARGDASRSRGAGRGTGAATGSTGLGLAIVQAVVSAHGGRVRVDSEPGRTVFVIELPVGADEARRAVSAGADEALRPDSAGAETARRADSQGGDRLSTPV
ncbi:cell wall metabolism sensor histidine kinase WalK [Streptomyces anulatus]|uniref:sensor histidine kinase n=1 Tax=Streptomyces anulatus TaxID=1892 RepID=UPI00224D8EE8|nr:HAMP domain-containing sensor histidine kinase [Streptomyces anulatus]MCX4519524.1 HAMP domain-containing histidine kinase [Streptomyces anulatus]WTD15009.1 HAMP domain-containing histidine kinase [Streptomyces anulatus]WTE08315.1 HAMP domain-containing histidine kinase [Streptomyces anulatus]